MTMFKRILSLLERQHEIVPNCDNLLRMRMDWDKMAQENAKHYIVNYKEEWTDEDFYRSGQESFDQLIANDLTNVCRGLDPKMMRVLEIGCGAGRVTRALAAFFGEVHGVDISPEMIERARRALAGYPNAFVYVNNGSDLAPVSHLLFDFAFSCCVFHHIPDVQIIEAYWHAVSAQLRPGALFKFEVQGDESVEPKLEGSWQGAPVPVALAVEMAKRAGFNFLHLHGGGAERQWIWLTKKSL